MPAVISDCRLMEKSKLGAMVRAGTLGALIGGTTGFALGLLVAPEKGQKMRRHLIYRFERLAWRAATMVEQLTQSEAESEARRTGDALVADAQVQAQRIREDIDELLSEMRRHSEQTSRK